MIIIIFNVLSNLVNNFILHWERKNGQIIYTFLVVVATYSVPQNTPIPDITVTSWT